MALLNAVGLMAFTKTLRISKTMTSLNVAEEMAFANSDVTGEV